MPPPKGPGRRMKPGPKIQQSAQLPIPDEAVENLLKEVLDGKDLEQFEQLPKKVKEEIIGHFKDALFKVTVKKFRPGVLGAEPEDLAGVFVSLSLNPSDLTSSAYYKKWAIGLLQNLTKISDFEIVQEAKLIGAAMAGETYNGRNPFKEVFGKEPLLDKKPVSYYEFDPRQIDRNNPRGTLRRATTLGGGVYYVTAPLRRTLPSRNGRPPAQVDLTSYEAFATSVAGFVQKSQAFTARPGALQAVYESFVNLVEEEIGTGGYGNLAPNNYLQGLRQTLVAEANNPVAQDFLRVPRHIEALLGKSKITKRSKKVNLRLSDLVGRQISTSAELRLRLKHLQTGRGGVDELTRFLLRDDNWKKLGFSSVNAVQALRSLKGQKELGDVSAALFTATYKGKLAMPFRPYSGGKIVPQLDSVSRSDLLLYRELVDSLNEQVNKVREAVLKHQISFVDTRFEDIVGLAVRRAPEEIKEQVKKDLENAGGYFKFVQARANQIIIGEFISAIESGNVWQVYFYYQKYNEHINKALGKVVPFYNTLVNIPIGKYKVGDIFTIESSIRDKVATSIGLTSAGYIESETPVLAKLLPFLTLNHVYLSKEGFKQVKENPASFFATLENERAAFGKSFTLFPGKTFSTLSEKYNQFKRSGPFSNIGRGVINIYAKDFEHAPHVLKVFEKLVAHDRSLVSGEAVHTLFASLYQTYKSGDPRVFNDLVTAFFGDVLSPAEIEAFLPSLRSILENFKKYEAKGLDPLDMFSTLIVHVKGNFIKGDSIKKYMGVLNGISKKINYAQTWVF
ncbi:MAG TPA: hypothetical protein ENJ78_00230, partial [candidate division WWE3 bacterium]|nr:hypothetical protein [candidate division WWE3 bacterium]